MGEIPVKEMNFDEMGLILLEGEPPVRLEDAKKVTVSMSLKGGLIYGAGKQETGETGNSEDGRF